MRGVREAWMLIPIPTQYPRNNNRPHVLLKVVALNRLYSAGVLAVHDVAYHIHRQAQDIDAALDIGAPEIVDRIAKVTISATGGEINYWSFGAKYCSWHNPDAYLLWDSRVRRYLHSLKGTEFAHPDLWTRYAEFKELMSNFCRRYQLESLNFKEIDKFLWKYGEKPENAESATSGKQI